MPPITKWEESWRKVIESGLVTAGGHLEYRGQGETVIKIGELVKHSPDGQCPYPLIIECIRCACKAHERKLYNDPAAFAVDAVEIKLKGEKRHFACTKVEDITVPKFRKTSITRAGRGMRYRPPGSSTDFAKLGTLDLFFQQVSKSTAAAASDEVKSKAAAASFKSDMDMDAASVIKNTSVRHGIPEKQFEIQQQPGGMAQRREPSGKVEETVNQRGVCVCLCVCVAV